MLKRVMTLPRSILYLSLVIFSIINIQSTSINDILGIVILYDAILKL